MFSCILTAALTYTFVHLQKGKLNEVNFILSGGDMGGLPSYTPAFFQDEPWVEFIEVDDEDEDAEEKDENRGSDTQRLLGLHQPVSHHVNIGPSDGVRYYIDSHAKARWLYKYE